MNTDIHSIRVQQSDELPLLQVSNRSATAVIVLQGAQVLRYQRRNSRHPLLWLSDLATYKRGQSIRGGIPVCWPWFGELARNPATIQQQFPGANAAAHGLVRGSNWLLENIDAHADATTVTLGCPTAAMGFPHIELQLQITVGDALHLRLRTINHGSTRFAFTQALHTYFAVSDIHRISVDGLENTRYIETLENWIEKNQSGAVTFAGETDRIYLDTPPRIDIDDRDWRRRIHLQVSGSQSAVVWNPWIEKAKRLSQFAADAWRDMLCIESTNVLGDSVALAPSKSHALDLTIAESSL